MYIALMSHDNKKDLMVQFCSAYAGILSRHGGSQQIGARIAYHEMDMVLFFVDPNDSSMDKELLYISRLCDQNNIPFASNVATAEMLVLGLDRGDLDWRNIVNPKNKLLR